MKKFTPIEIQDGLDKAFVAAGHNAYFGNGFRMGIEFAQDNAHDRVVTSLLGFITNDKDLIHIKKDSGSNSFHVSFNAQNSYESYSAFDIAIESLKVRYDSIELISTETTSIEKHDTPIKIK